MLVDLLFCQIQFLIQSLPDRLLRSKSKGKINSIKGHPIDVSFPVMPLPPGRTITHSAHVLIIPESVKLWNNINIRRYKQIYQIITNQARSHLSFDVIFTRTSGRVFGNVICVPSHDTWTLQ